MPITLSNWIGEQVDGVRSIAIGRHSATTIDDSVARIGRRDVGCRGTSAELKAWIVVAFFCRIAAEEDAVGLSATNIGGACRLWCGNVACARGLRLNDGGRVSLGGLSRSRC